MKQIATFQIVDLSRR